MFGINWSPNWTQLHKNLGMLGAFLSLAVQFVPALSVALPQAAPVLHSVGSVLALTGLVAHQVDDAAPVDAPKV